LRLLRSTTAMQRRTPQAPPQHLAGEPLPKIDFTSVNKSRTTRRPVSDGAPAPCQAIDYVPRLLVGKIHDDLHQARTGSGPAVMATLRNTAIGWHRITGATNIARATRQANRDHTT
jgi:hypothetical protein